MEIFVLKLTSRLCATVQNVTYTDMALQALEAMDTKGGGSLVAVRKWIVAQYPETMTKQKASFNSLTKKVTGQFESSRPGSWAVDDTLVLERCGAL